MMTDLKFVVRSLARSRGFTAVVVLTLALGIGSAVAIFSAADWVLFQADRFPADVLLVGGLPPDGEPTVTRYDFQARAYAEQSHAMAAYAKASYVAGNIVVDGEPVGSSWVGVSANFFPMFGIAPALGRGFLPGEDTPGADDVVIVNDSFWKRSLGGRPDVLGRKIRLGDSLCTVVGVLRQGQRVPPRSWAEVYRPLAYRVDPVQPWNPYLSLFGKLAPGVSRKLAEQELSGVKPDVPAPMRDFNRGQERVVLSAMSEIESPRTRRVYGMLVGAVGFLFAIACLNAANLLMVRMLGRRRELGIRLSLGGGRLHVIRLVLVECLGIGLLAAAAGAVVANWLFPVLQRAAGDRDAGNDLASWKLDWRVMGVLGLLTLLTCLFIALLPAVRILRANLNEDLKEGGACLGESPRLARVRAVLVVLQTAFAVILLAGAGLMIRTFQRLEKADLGFAASNRAKLVFGFAHTDWSHWQARVGRLKEIEAELLRTPGIQAAAFGSDVLLPGYQFDWQSAAGPGDQKVKFGLAGFDENFPTVAGLRLQTGHWQQNPEGSEVLVSETVARACWPGINPIGQFLRPVRGLSGPPPTWKGWPVIGVVQDIRGTLREGPGAYVYGPEAWMATSFNTFVLVLSRPFDATLASAVRKRLFALDSNLIVQELEPFDRIRENQLWAERTADSMLRVLAGIATILTIVGVYSVLSYTVDRRMDEFGLRLALGATRENLLRLVLKRGLALAVIGTVLGIAGALALGDSIQALLYETSPHEPWVFGVVVVASLAVSALACVVPSWRAARADVTALLRSE